MRRLLFAVALVVCFALPASADGVIPLEGEVTNAAAVHITPNGLEFVGDVAAQALAGFDLETMLMELNPLVEITSCLLIFMGAINFESVNLDHFAFDISSTPIMGMNDVPGALYARVAAYPVDGQYLITVAIDGAWNIGCTDPFNATGSLTADPLEIGVSLSLDYSPGDGMVLMIHQVVLGEDSLNVLFEGLPDPALDDLLQMLISEVLPSLIEDIAPELINEALAELLEAIVLEGATPVGDYTLAYAFDPDFFSGANGFSVATDGSLFLEGVTVDSCIEPPFPIGSPYTNGPLPTFGTQTPGGDPYDLGLFFSDDLFNQLIYSFLVKGDLCLMFPFGFDDHLTLADLAGLIPDFELPPGLEDGGNLIDIYPVDLPRVVVGEGDTDLALVADPLRLDWYIEIEGRYVAMLTTDISLNLGLVLDIDEENNLIISFDENASLIHFEVYGNEWNILPPALIETLLNGLIDNFLMPLLANLLPPIPLPSIGGYQFVIHEIGATGAGNDYFGMYAEFVETPPAADVAFDLPHLGLTSAATLGPRQSARAGLSATTSPELRLASIGAVATDDFRVRVDGGAWRVVRGDRVDLSSLLDGAHVIEAVPVVDGRILTAKPARLAFVLDRVAPRVDAVTLRPKGDGALIAVEAHDYVAPRGRLRYQFRTAGGAWSKPQRAATLVVPATPTGQRLEARVLDPSGNASAARSVGSPWLQVH